MSKIYTKTYNNLNIKEIKIDKFPVILFSDSHTNLSNVKELQRLYPNNQLICLGDITFLFSKPGEKFNHYSIDFFIENKIPCLKGNHEQYIIQNSEGSSLYLNFDENAFQGDIYDLSQQQLDYLKSLPIGFKLLLPDGKNYYCFHNEPQNLWNFPDEINKQYFKDHYIFDDQTIAVIQGHLHFNQITIFKDFPIKRYVIGQLSNTNHHTGVQNGRNYALLTEDGIEFKKI